MEDGGLADHLLQDVAQAGREDEQRDAVVVQAVEELLVAVPVESPSHHWSPTPGALGIIIIITTIIMSFGINKVVSDFI